MCIKLEIQDVYGNEILAYNCWKCSSRLSLQFSMSHGQNDFHTSKVQGFETMLSPDFSRGIPPSSIVLDWNYLTIEFCPVEGMEDIDAVVQIEKTNVFSLQYLGSFKLLLAFIQDPDLNLKNTHAKL